LFHRIDGSPGRQQVEAEPMAPTGARARGAASAADLAQTCRRLLAGRDL
jgi:hypothetical protein